jgi:serine/threonine protein kinase
MQPLKLAIQQEVVDEEYDDEFEEWARVGDIDPDQIEKCEDLGEGAGGSVNRCIDRRTGKIMAVKRIKPDHGSSEEMKMKKMEIRKELVALLDSDCPDLITLYGAYMDSDDCMNICLEFMDMGSLLDVVEAAKSSSPNNPIPESILRHIVMSVLRGLNFLHHDRHFMHRDLKPSNILVNSEGQIKVTDFGVGGELENTLASTHTFVGTVHYMAPEVC